MHAFMPDKAAFDVGRVTQSMKASFFHLEEYDVPVEGMRISLSFIPAISRAARTPT